MEREYTRWFSKPLGRDMEMLIFGHTGTPVIFFPTRAARFFDYENWRVIEAMRQKIEEGHIQVYCLDSVDAEAFYCDWSPPESRLTRHTQYELYIKNEVIPFIKKRTKAKKFISAGCSMGAYHAVNLAFRYPQHFVKVVGMSGRYDLTEHMGYFRDLLDGYRDEKVYQNMPNQYIGGMEDSKTLKKLSRLEITLAVGTDDAFLDNNKRLSRVLKEKNIPHNFYIWGEEAHKPHYWRKMVKIYL